MLRLDTTVWHEILAEAWRVYPEEACGLPTAEAGGGPDAPIVGFLPVRNAAASSRIFQLDPMGYMKAERAADDGGLEIVGVMHSHTHTGAYPSPTDVGEATKPLVPPSWHWVIVSLAWGEPVVLIPEIVDAVGDVPVLAGQHAPAGIAEEPVALA